MLRLSEQDNKQERDIPREFLDSHLINVIFHSFAFSRSTFLNGRVSLMLLLSKLLTLFKQLTPQVFTQFRLS